jgi:hypothetical protein
MAPSTRAMTDPAGRMASDVLELEQSVGTALARRQDRDGFWRDFQLPPGRAQAWSTAWIGWCLAHLARSPQVDHALLAATQALADQAGPNGWGYNGNTACDADSTAWSLLFLALTAPAFAHGQLPSLDAYIDSAGGVHTFSESHYGAWNDVHPEVTAVAILAATSTGAAPALLLRMRRSLAASVPGSGPAPSYWWDTPAYRLAWTVLALDRTGGVPAPVAALAGAWLRGQAGQALSDFEHALHLLCACALPALDELGAWHALRLVASSAPSGWPGSCVLLVPPQRPGNDTLPRGPHADSGAMTSALAIAALARWRRGLEAGLANPGPGHYRAAPTTAPRRTR